jgi:hypothetical protein
MLSVLLLLVIMLSVLLRFTDFYYPLVFSNSSYSGCVLGVVVLVNKFTYMRVRDRLATLH